MQIQKLNLTTGESVVILGMDETSPPRTSQSLIDECVSTSTQDDGYHVVCGSGLDLAADERVCNIAASQGVLTFQNIFVPPNPK